MIKTILLDMDCVITNFVDGLAKLWGSTQAELESLQPLGKYNYCTALSALEVQRYGPMAAPVTEARFWQRIESKRGFWADLEEFHWTRDLLDMVRSYTDNWYVVSSPSRCPRCIPEKREWLHRLLNVDWFDRLIPTPHKELMAKPGVVLIDDYEVNCVKFKDEGGKAILFPAHHNMNHDLKHRPLGFVHSQLDRLKETL